MSRLRRLFSRMPIGVKLFVALFAVCAAVAAGMGVGVRISFERGFLSYVNRLEANRMAGLARRLSRLYRDGSGWGGIQEDRALWERLDGAPQAVRRPGAAREGAPGLSIFDASGALVAGSASPRPDALQADIVVDGKVVGTLFGMPLRQVTNQADLQFQQEQTRMNWVIAFGALLLAGAAAVLLSRALLSPLRRLADATGRLSAGDFSVQVPVDGEDEIGQLSRSFNGLAETLNRNDRMRRQFMADVTHELRTPLAVLRAEIEQLEDGLRAPTADALGSLRAEMDKLTRLVDDIQQLALSDVGVLRYFRERLDVTALVTEAIESWAPRLAAHHLTLRLAAGGDGPAARLLIDGDPARLEQVLGNLLENAERYVPAGGQVVVRCGRDGDRALIEIDDSGKSVSDAALARLFERFYREEASRSRTTGGAGLGLAICRTIVEAHSGTIVAARSTLGGLRIEIRLPLVSEVRG
ncbi:MAG TPA: ATP-binding protein [Polyangia bacterium]|nr:ATP-binding protein [Polyangia bacterium]